MSRSLTCQGCGKRLSIPEGYTRRKMQCPECGVYVEVPTQAQKKAEVAKPPSRDVELPATAELSEEAYELPPDVWPDAGPKPVPYAQPVEEEMLGTDLDDGKPYRLTGAGDRHCRDCKEVLAPDAKLCPKCGLNLETGEKAVRVFEPVERHWEAGLPLQRRVRIFVICELAIGIPAVLLAIFLGRFGTILTPWLIFSALLAFILGTYDRLDLTRNKRGRVMLTQTWRVCFYPRQSVTIPLREYEGVVVNLSHDDGIMDRVLLAVGIIFFVLPGLIWWLWAMQQDTYHVALTQHHGFPERVVYQGWSRNHANEIAQTLHELAGLPYEAAAT